MWSTIYVYMHNTTVCVYIYIYIHICITTLYIQYMHIINTYCIINIWLLNDRPIHSHRGAAPAVCPWAMEGIGSDGGPEPTGNHGKSLEKSGKITLDHLDQPIFSIFSMWKSGKQCDKTMKSGSWLSFLEILPELWWNRCGSERWGLRWRPPWPGSWRRTAVEGRCFFIAERWLISGENWWKLLFSHLPFISFSSFNVWR